MIVRAALFAVALLSTPARASSDAEAGADEDSLRRVTPSIGVGVLAGVAVPHCSGQAEACSSSLGTAPSVRAFALYQPTASFGFGLAGQLARVHWEVPYRGAFTGVIESTLTTAFAGITARWDVLTWVPVTPILDLDIGAAFQGQTGTRFGCNAGAIPTAQVGLGAAGRISSSFSALLRIGASGGLKEGCATADGPPMVPFVGWGYDVRVGAAFDVGVR